MSNDDFGNYPVNGLPVCPYTDLFIYYLKGVVRTETFNFGPDFIGAWIEDGVSFLFFSRSSKSVIDQFMLMQPALELLDVYQMSYSDWQGEILGPGRFGCFFVAPPWSTRPETMAEEKYPIVLDPGVVFGNGSHPTTLSCLQALELAFETETHQSVLDLGTGTGLLAIAAARLGCPKVLAIDHNLLAVRTARNNICYNRLEDRILAIQGLAEDFISTPADLLVANIHYDVMKHLIDTDGFLSKKGVILSGLLRSQAMNILAALSGKPFQIIRKWELDGTWCSFFGKRT